MARRTKEEAALTRQQILKAALTVFGAKGYSAATLEEIAGEAGVTRGAIYWHFKNKAELYNALIETYSARGATVTRQAVAEGGSLVDILRRIFVSLLVAVEEEPDLRAIMEIHLFKTGLSPDLQPGRQQQVQAGAALLSGIAAAMRKGVASGELRSDLAPEDMARAFLALQNGAIYLWLMDPQAFSLSQRAGSLAEIFLGGVVAGEG
jgi:TetR/AcrR family acrAB operon transcriptional repressor